MSRLFVKNTFGDDDDDDDDDIQLGTNRFDRNTYYTVSGSNFAYSFSFLRSQRMQSYSAIPKSAN